MIAAHPSGLLTTAESARLVRVSPVTIRAWRRLGWLEPQGLSEQGYPMHSAEAVREAARQVRQNGISKGGFDPRLLRSQASPAAA